MHFLPAPGICGRAPFSERRRHVPALLLRVALGWLVMIAAVTAAPVPGGTEVLKAAQRQIGDGPWQPVTLPDWPLDPPLVPIPATVRYRAALPPNAVPEPALLMQGLVANASLHFNGHLLRGPVHASGQVLPRGADRLLIVSLPTDLWRPEGNVFEIRARGQNRMSVSRLELGDRAALESQHRRLVYERFVGPLVAGCVVGTLGLGMLALWARLREPSFLFFAVGAIAWWLSNWMPLVPWPAIGGVAYAIAWISLFGVVVAAFAAFCLRVARWHWPRLEAALFALAAAGPLLLAGAYAVDHMDVVSSVWRLALIGGIVLALAAVCSAAWKTRSPASLAMLVCGVVAAALSVHDWWVDLDETLNNPPILTPYAGLVFAVAATALLVQRYVAAARNSAALNQELEQRVAAQGVQLRQALMDMQAARDDARAADRAKSSFLAIASHDLRQPAHALGLYLEAMPGDNLDAEQTEVLDRLRESHRALERMFDALLDISRIDAGTLAPQLQRLVPWDLLQALADESAPAAEAKGLRLVLRAGAGAAEAQVTTDALLLERMLRNLISNAIKYTQAGGVLLSCRLRRRAGGQVLCLEVWDSGAGISAADRGRIFEEFFQVRQGRPAAGAADGLGLGLPIVRRLADLLGIRVDLRSRPGRGSCFSLVLPLAPRPELAPAPRPELAPAPASDTAFDPQQFHGVRVGVLEDDPHVRDALVRVLRRWGGTVHAGGSAEELVRVSGDDRHRLQVLIVDFALAHDVSGPAEAQAFQAATGSAPKVLLVTGEQSPDRLRHMASLQLPWLAKPVLPEALWRAVTALVAASAPATGEQP